MAVVHVIGAGSDAGSPWLQAPLALTMSAVLTLLGYRVLDGGPVRGATPPRRAPAPAPSPREAPTQPMPVVAPVAADEAPTTVAAPSGYRPLWARNTSPPAS